jgi:predicted Rossmann-fold nucleotide-binding protein
METVCRAFHSVNERVGRIVGIIPGTVDDGGHQAMPGYPNPWIEIPIHTHLPLSGERGTELASRNHINVLTANVLVALPGSHGTASEVRLAVQYEKPLVAFVNTRDDIPGLPPETYVEPDFDKVKNFVRTACYL